jgi:hypothetical protein
MMTTTASASGGDGGVAGSLSEVQRPTGSSTAIAKFCSTDGSEKVASRSGDRPAIILYTIERARRTPGKAIPQRSQRFAWRAREATADVKGETGKRN